MSRSSSLIIIVSVGLAACSNAPRHSDEPTVTRPPPELDVFAAIPDASSWSFERRAFAVGIQSELRIADDSNVERTIQSLTCRNDACEVKTQPSAHDSTEQLFLVTPKTSDFQIHAVLEPRDGEPSVVDRLVHARNSDFIALHPGPGAGTPFLSGMRIVWYVGPKETHIAWKAEGARVTVSPPFELVDEPFARVVFDQDPFIRVEVRAPESDTIVRGEVTLETGALTKTFALIAVPQAEIVALHVAPAPATITLEREERAPPLERIVGDTIRVPMLRGRDVWVVFETKSGEYGIAGSGDCLPSPAATELFDLLLPSEPPNHPFVTIMGRKPGTGELLLVAGNVTGSAQVTVVEGEL